MWKVNQTEKSYNMMWKINSVPLVLLHELWHVKTERAQGGNIPLCCKIESLSVEFTARYTDSMLTWSCYGHICWFLQDNIANTCGPLPYSQSEPHSKLQPGFTLDQPNKSPVWPTSHLCNCCNRSHECTWCFLDYKCRNLCHSVLMSLINVIDC